MVGSRREVLTGAACMAGGSWLVLNAGRAAAPAAAETVAQKVELTAADGHKFSAYRATPAGPAKGGIVILHAVYGLTTSMGAVCGRWAENGYTAIAPALFDRLQRDLVHPYTKAGVDAGSASYGKLTEAQIFADVEACAAAAGPAGRVAISGFCTGGSWSWRASAKRPFAAQVNFYGSHIATPEYFELEPRCSTILHYGDKDVVVPPPDVARIRARHPSVDIQVYAGAGHAFLNPDQTANYHAASAEPAWGASIAFMDRHVGV